jgi:hypothetical protein
MMRKFLGLLFAVLLLTVPAAAQEEPICTTVPEELTFHDWGGELGGPFDVRAYLYGGNEEEGRTGYIDYNPWSGPNLVGVDWLIGTVDFLYCSPDNLNEPKAHIVFETIADRQCTVVPFGCDFEEDCDLSCVGVWPRPIGPFTYWVDWNDDLQSYLDVELGWDGETIYFDALALQLKFPRAYYYRGYFDRDEDGNCTFSESRTLYVWKIDLLDNMRLVMPHRHSPERRR